MGEDTADDLQMSRARRSRATAKTDVNEGTLSELPDTKIDQFVQTHLISNEAQSKVEYLVDNNHPNDETIAVWLQTPSQSTEESVVVSAEDNDTFKQLLNELPNEVKVKIQTDNNEYQGIVEVYVKQIEE